jgi:hypothetical protein
MHAFIFANPTGVELQDRDDLPESLERAGQLYERLEIRNPGQSGVKHYVYSPFWPSSDELGHILGLVERVQFGAQCLSCGQPVSLKDDVVPDHVVDSVPHLRHITCAPSARLVPAPT